MPPLPVERRRARNAAVRRSGCLPVERVRGLPSPSSVIRIDPNNSMEQLRTTLGDGFVENFGIALVLFETPSGFAVFGFFVLHLYGPDAKENLWANFNMYERARNIIFLEEFQTFDDKSSAINVGTGVNRQLTEMIMKWYRPGHTLVVGEEYKSIIESSLEIPCLYDGIVMELMWGHAAPHAQVGARRKIRTAIQGPCPYESRTANVPESIWLSCRT